MGKKLIKKLKETDVGAIGIGAMIVFIAMVLVAGIAASVLVQTANKLEIQAMQTGDQTRAEVATGIAVVDIEAEKASSGTQDLYHIALMVQPRAGSQDIDLSETFIEISDSTTKNVLTYKQANFKNKSEIAGDIFTDAFFTGLTGTDFGIIVIEDADGSCTYTTPVINRGDKVLLTILCDTTGALGRQLPERTDVWGMVSPEQGAPGVFGFRTPASYAQDTVFDLY